MISFTVETKNEALISSAISGLRGQLPFAYATALNATANDAQAAIKSSLSSRFVLRREDFIRNTIYRTPGQDFATKTKLEAAVRVNPARDYLAKFEDGGLKTSASGKALAIPILRADDKSLIIRSGDALSVKRLMDSIQNRGGRVLRPRVRKGMLRVSEDPNKVYLVQDARGTFIVQRTGPSTTRVLYAFKRSVPIAPELHFEEIAMTTAVARWYENFANALDYAIATAR